MSVTDTPETPALAASITEFFDSLHRVTQMEIPGLATTIEGEHEALAILLAFIRRAQHELKDAEQFVEDVLAKKLPWGDHTIPGLGVVRLRSGRKRTQWQHDELINVVAHRIAADLPDLANAETGELVSLIDTVLNVLGTYRQAASPSWKTGGLRSLGIDPDMWCESTKGRKTVETPALPALSTEVSDADPK